MMMTSLPAIDSVGWLRSSSYWMPRHHVLSAWREHAPFASWLMDVARPRIVAELGTHAGFSFFVFAEARARIGFECDLYALDSWEGDDQAGFYDDEVYRSVEAISEADYQPHTHLLRGYFADSADRFEDGSIDLLHVDGRHGYDDVKEDFETYRPKLSPRAVVLFHDTNEFQEGFGVHRFWAEVSAEAPSFEFHHGHGLGVLALGAEAPAEVLALIESANADPELIRRAYAELGARVEKQYELEVSNVGSLRNLHPLVEAQQGAIEGLQQERAGFEEEIRRLHEQRDRLMADAADAARASAAASVEAAALRNEIAGLAAQVSAMRSSRSWRVTAPVRSVVETVRRRR